MRERRQPGRAPQRITKGRVKKQAELVRGVTVGREAMGTGTVGKGMNPIRLSFLPVVDEVTP